MNSSSCDPQPAPLVPVLDRQFGVAVEALVAGTDLRLDPALLVAQQEVHARRRPRQRRVDRRGEGVHQLGPSLVADPERGAATLAEMPVGRSLAAVDRRVPYAERAFAAHFKCVGYPHDIDCIPAATRALATNRAIASLIGVRGVTVDGETDR